MATYSKRDREMAALHCAAMASNPEAHAMAFGRIDENDVAASVGASENARRLAEEAWLHAWYRDPLSAEREAEAEALIRTGWTPQSAARRARKAGR